MKHKKEYKRFGITEYEKEQEYLQEMHKHGWKFKRVTGLGMYYFEECEPADVIYQLDYNQEGIAHKDEYVQMFEDCGWEYMQDFWGWSYFRKPVGIMNDDEGIFCDDESRLELLNRIFIGRLLPLLVVFFLICIPQFINALIIDKILAGVIAGLIIIYLTIFIMFGKKYYEFKKRVQSK